MEIFIWLLRIYEHMDDILYLYSKLLDIALRVKHDKRFSKTTIRCSLLRNAGLFWATLQPCELHCILVSYTASFWDTLHPSEIHCILLRYTASFWDTMHPSEIHYILLRYTASFWATLRPSEQCRTLRARLHPTELRCTHLSYYATSCLRSTLLSGATHNWAVLHPEELSCTLRAAVPYWTTLQPTELRCTLLSFYASSWLRSTLLSVPTLNWAMVHPHEHCPTELRAALCCILTKPPPNHFLECRNDGLFCTRSVRYWNKKKYWCRN